ncbi:MAG TPA: hypothetical protein VG651_21215 [Stellaceae bacterium]|nr:hypothetical protein [Stellaceae bacterium]
MARANTNDRASLEQAYPRDAFANDAAQNERAPHALTHGVLIASAPDEGGWFELTRTRRHAGEPDTPYFLAPARRSEELIEQGHHHAARQVAMPDPARGYARFLDDIVTAAKSAGFRADRSPSGDPRLRGLRGG